MNPLDHGPNGRIERRLPIIVVVRLAPAVSVTADGERTFTRVTPLNADSAWAKVIYSQRLPDDRYCIGVKFQDRPVTWPAIRRYGDI